MPPILYGVQYSVIIKRFGEGGGSIQLNRLSQPQLINNFSVYKDGTQTTFIYNIFVHFNYRSLQYTVGKGIAAREFSGAYEWCAAYDKKNLQILRVLYSSIYGKITP
jgi:hypothetical protein